MTIDLTAPTKDFPHYWERCVGSCHTATALRADWQAQMEQCRRELGFEYMRCHGWLNDDMNVCSDYNGARHYSFFNIDAVCDFLLKIGMKPIIELSFMPQCLASGPQTVFHYRGNITPPNDYAAWGVLMEKLAQHLLKRYGRKEVASWYFEVWNEPNLDAFWAGTQADYFKLYEVSARAIKLVCPEFRVGGPSTAQNAWIPEFIAYCQKHKVPFDFVSTHHYPTDSALGMGEDMEDQMAASPRGVVTTMATKARAEAGKHPLLYTEWNTSPSCRDPYHDRPYAAAFAVKSIVDNSSLLDMYSFWTFSDIFEEVPIPQDPFYGGFGLLTTGGIAKPVYRAFQFLHRLGHKRIPVQVEGAGFVEAVATYDDSVVQLLLHHHHVPRVALATETVQVFFPGKGKAPDRVVAEVIDEHSAHARAAWEAMGSPLHLDEEMKQKLYRASLPRIQFIPTEQKGNHGWGFALAMPPHSVASLSISLE